jgi:CheY-like chemotaxis protein
MQGEKMRKAVVTGQNREKFREIEKTLRQHPVEIVWASNGTEALDLVTAARDSGRTVDLLIIDELLEDMTGRTLVEQVIAVSPMTNCAAVSSLSATAFHDAFEGFGVLMQLPGSPTEKDGQSLVSCMKKIKLL